MSTDARVIGQGELTLRIRDRSDYKAQMNDLLELTPETTAVVTVDLQRDYVDLDVATCPAEPADAERVMRASKDLLDFARAAGMPVVHAYVQKTRTEFDAGVFGGPFTRVSTQNKLSQNSTAGVRKDPDRLLGTPQAEVPAELVAPSDLHVTSKRTNDACFQTNLPLILERVCKARAVLMLGVNTDTCVYATAFSISNLGYLPVIVGDAVASTRGQDHHAMALELMSRTFCWVLPTETIKQKLQAGASA